MSTSALYLSGNEGYAFPILPDNSLAWNCHPIDSLSGNYYANSGADPEVAEAIFQEVASLPSHRTERIGTGQFAHVSRVGGMAIKSFRETTWQSVASGSTGEVDIRAGLSAVIANVALHEGLDRIKQPLLATKNNPRYTAPRILGAFVGYEPWNKIPGRTSPIVWAMSFEEGHHPDPDEMLPSSDKQTVVYDKALEACGVSPDSVFYDNKNNNLIVQKGGRQLVKLDVTANHSLWEQ